jgi:hypothetical protein
MKLAHFVQWAELQDKGGKRGPLKNPAPRVSRVIDRKEMRIDEFTRWINRQDNGIIRAKQKNSRKKMYCECGKTCDSSNFKKHGHGKNCPKIYKGNQPVQQGG